MFGLGIQSHYKLNIQSRAALLAVTLTKRSIWIIFICQQKFVEFFRPCYARHVQLECRAYDKPTTILT